MKKKLMRNKEAGIFTGLCQGLGERFELTPWLFRAAFIIPALPMVLNFGTTLASIILYIALSIIIKDCSRVDGRETIDAEYEIIDDQDNKEEKADEDDSRQS